MAGRNWVFVEGERRGEIALLIESDGSGVQ